MTFILLFHSFEGVVLSNSLGGFLVQLVEDCTLVHLLLHIHFLKHSVGLRCCSLECIAVCNPHVSGPELVQNAAAATGRRYKAGLFKQNIWGKQHAFGVC